MVSHILLFLTETKKIKKHVQNFHLPDTYIGWSYPRFVGAQSRVVFPAEGWSVMGRKGSHSEQFRLEACKLVSEQGY
ncbi:MAG TPA: hypothetical protein VHX86_07605, partial [Tepidisphaeraceae bacterium]|nr:hypothetical protein [Tepidisphaeraceae bacterium]